MNRRDANFFGAGRSKIHQVLADALCPIIMSTAMSHNCSNLKQVIAVCHDDFFWVPMRGKDYGPDTTMGDISLKELIAQEHHLHWTLDGVRMTPQTLKTMFNKCSLLDFDYINDWLKYNEEKWKEIDNIITDAVRNTVNPYNYSNKTPDNLTDEETYDLLTEWSKCVLTVNQHKWLLTYLDTLTVTSTYWEDREEEDKIMAA